jgi:hypothetical protein
LATFLPGLRFDRSLGAARTVMPTAAPSATA